MIEAVKELAGGMGVSVCRAAGEWPEGSPLVVLVDDLHLREGLHLGELIQRVQARGALLVWSAVADAGARQPASPSLMPQLSQLQGPTVALSPLDRSNTLALLRNRGVVGQLGPVLGRRLHEELGGWPGSIVEQLECLESQGWLKRSGTRLTADVEMEGFRSAALPVPELRRLDLVSRIAEISPTARRMLEVVAVVGGRAHTELLRSIAPVSSAELSELASLRLVRIEEDGLERLVVLQAPGLGRVLCESLEDSHRVALHGQVAEALLARHARRPGAMAAVMADHLVQANQSERAWPLLVQAARRASRRRDPVKVLALTNQALEAGVLAREGLPEAEVARLQGQTLALRGQAMLACQRPLEAKEILTEALALGDPEESMVQAAHSALGAALVALGLPEQAAQLLEPLIGRLETGHPARPSVLRAMAEAQRLLGDLEASEATWREGLALARDLGSQESEGLCLLGLAGTVLQRNQLVEAREELVLARPLLRSARSQNEARCVRYLAELEALDGRYRTALSLADEAADLAQACEDLETWSGALNVTAEILTLAGRERDAARLYSEIRTVRGALELQSQGPCLSLQAKSSLDEARGLEAEGDHFPALGRLEEAWSNLPDRGAGGLAHQVALALCRLDPDTHRHGRASQIARAIAEELPPDLAASFRARPDVQDLLG